MSKRLRYWRTRSWVDELLCAAQDAAIREMERTRDGDQQMRWQQPVYVSRVVTLGNYSWDEC